MQTKYFRSAGLAFLVSINFFASFDLCAWVPSPGILDPPTVPFATVSYGDGKTLSVPFAENNNFDLIGVYPDQILQINLKFPTSNAGQIISMGLADGGTITTPTVAGALVVSPDGTVAIGFQAPHDPGEYRVWFSFGSIESVLPLYVLDPIRAARPQRFPTAN
jgi:hypothetical protein